VAGSAANREDRRHNRGPKRFIVGAVALIIGGLLTAGALGDVAPITVTGSSASSDSPAATDASAAVTDSTTTALSSTSVTYSPTIVSDKADAGRDGHNHRRRLARAGRDRRPDRRRHRQDLVGHWQRHERRQR
jgi:hypothetical protein